MYPNIDAERARNGMSKAMLAEKLGVSYSTFKSWMTGYSSFEGHRAVEDV